MGATSRPSFWVDEPGGPTAWRAVAIAALASLTGCPETSGESVDAAMRADTAIVETGLAFQDARAEDALLVGADALPSRDGGPPLCRGACDPVRAPGCGSSGEACVVQSEEAMCGVPGRGSRGASCTGVGDCATGLACFATDTGVGVCDRVCCPGASDCTGSAVCGGDGALIDGTRTSWGRCLAPRACRLLDPEACPEREACYVIGPLGESECLLAGSALEGDRCELPNDCTAGLVCTGATDRTCARLCALGTSSDPCGASAMCVRQAYTPDGVGVCVAAAASRP